VSWRRWGLKDNPYSSIPIDETTLELFIGRSNEIQTLQDALSSAKSVIFLQSQNGLGATALGNFWRYNLSQRRLYFSPYLELRVEAGQDFYQVLANLIESLNWSIKQKYLYMAKDEQFVTHEAKSAHFFAAVSSRLTYKNFHEVGGQCLYEEAKKLFNAIRNIVLRLGYEHGILLQICLQYLQTNSDYEHLYEFKEKMPPLFSMEHYKWLLIGNGAIKKIFYPTNQKNSAPYWSEIPLAPLEFKELEEILQHRKEQLALNQYAKLPIDTEVIKYLYSACNGRLKDVFSICTKLMGSLDGYQINPEVNLESARPTIKKILQEHLQEKNLTALSFEIMEFLAKNGHAASSVIAAQLQKRRPNISKILNHLNKAGLVQMEVRGRNRIYYPLTEVKLAFGETSRMG